MSRRTVTVDGDVASVPLLARDGSIKGYATIDASDAEWVGQWLWRLDPDGYARRSDRRDGKPLTVFLHREILGLPWEYDGREGDHVDRIKLNCRRENLRVVSHGGNVQNASSRGGASEYRNVYWSKPHQKWRVIVQVDGKVHHIGLFDNEEEAASAAQEARLRLLPYAVD